MKETSTEINSGGEQISSGKCPQKETFPKLKPRMNLAIATSLVVNNVNTSQLIDGCGDCPRWSEFHDT